MKNHNNNKLSQLSSSFFSNFIFESLDHGLVVLIQALQHHHPIIGKERIVQFKVFLRNDYLVSQFMGLI